MEREHWHKVDRLFQSAFGLEESQRAAFLEQACAGDDTLKQQVESLLANAAQASFLETPAVELAAHALKDVTGAHPIPAAIGRYRVLRLLGEGGMGSVYEAEQDQPRRIVALKVIKPGLATDEALRRFQQEAEALGRLHHPGIAEIHEASTADTALGPRPYFAMELIRGRPLHEYAEAQHLNTRERLALMAKVCDAVEHAHQRGVIHRDLKPGNILVEETGQPKILDFGVARLVGSDSQLTRQTDLGQLIGTLAYMSPEQVAGDPSALDMRSDVYALGVILYELLAHKLPYDINHKPLHEAVGVIREEEPPRLGTIDRRYRGDISTVVAKALEKDKTRRYGAAADLAADIRRYLANEPISARPASTSYWLQKFARRHKTLVAAAGVVFLVMAAAVVVSTREAVRARQAERTAEAIDGFLRDDLLAQASVMNQAGPGTKPDPDLKVREVLDRAAARITAKFDRQPEVEAAIRDTIGQAYRDLNLYGSAEEQFDLAIKLYGRVLGPEDPKTLRTIGHRASVLAPAAAEESYRRTLSIQRRVLGTGNMDTLTSLQGLAAACSQQGEYPQAEAATSEALEISLRVLGPEHPGTLASMHQLAIVYARLGKLAQSEALFARTVDVRRRVLGPDHPDTLRSMNGLALVYSQQGKLAQAEPLFVHICCRRGQANPHS